MIHLSFMLMFLDECTHIFVNLGCGLRWEEFFAWRDIILVKIGEKGVIV